MEKEESLEKKIRQAIKKLTNSKHVSPEFKVVLKFTNNDAIIQNKGSIIIPHMMTSGNDEIMSAVYGGCAGLVWQRTQNSLISNINEKKYSQLTQIEISQQKFWEQLVYKYSSYVHVHQELGEHTAGLRAKKIMDSKWNRTMFDYATISATILYKKCRDKVWNKVTKMNRISELYSLIKPISNHFDLCTKEWAEATK